MLVLVLVLVLVLAAVAMVLPPRFTLVTLRSPKVPS
jgi:hypothetical protein